MAAQPLSACVAEIKSNPGKFYVYILFRPDGTPFYVGCGGVRYRRFRGRERIAAHEVEARSLYRSHKCNVIRSIWRGGKEVGYQVVEWRSTEAEIFKAEVMLIASIGRHDLRRGPLTNRTDGGDGIVARSEEMKRRASKTMSALIDDEWRARSSRIVKAHWDTPIGREKRRIATASPQATARRVAASKATAAGPGNVKRSATMKEVWRNEEYKVLQSARHLQAVTSPKYREKMGSKARARWADPAYRERLREVHRARWALRRKSATAI